MRNIFLWIHREVIFDVLCIQREHIELLHESDHLRASEVAECVAGQAQAKRRRLVSVCAFLSECDDVAWRRKRCRNEGSGASEITTGQSVFPRGLIISRSGHRLEVELLVAWPV